MKPMNWIKSRNQSVYIRTQDSSSTTFFYLITNKNLLHIQPSKAKHLQLAFLRRVYPRLSINFSGKTRPIVQNRLTVMEKRKGKKNERKRKKKEAHINHTLDKIPTQLYTLLGCAVPVLALNLDLFPKQFCNNLARRRGLVPDEKWSERISVLFFSTAERGTASLKGAPPTVLSSSMMHRSLPVCKHRLLFEFLAITAICVSMNSSCP